MNKIIFILGAIHMQRCVKRIDEFVDNGFKVDAYAFDRGVKALKKPKDIDIHIMNYMDNSSSYINRLPILYKSIKEVVGKYKKEDVIFYAFGLEQALMISLLSNKPYIYEESDLVHTYMCKVSEKIFEYIDKRIIKKSLMSVFTSEGFLKFHFGEKRPNNTYVIANKLPVSIKELDILPSKAPDVNNLRIGFVGYIRFNSIYNFAKVCCEKFPNLQFHFYGEVNNEADRQLFDPLHKYDNCIFHGAFKHPDDLPRIYSELDLVLSTYDVVNENVRYAEPNKIYEAIYFQTPIIVSKGTFLGEKVNAMGIGYEIDPLDNKAVESFIKNLSDESLSEIFKSLQSIQQEEALNINTAFFDELRKIIN